MQLPSARNRGEALAKYEPSPVIGERIRQLAAVGIPQEQIAVIEKIDPKTLRKYYKVQFDEGFITANANIGKSGYEMAVGRPAEYDRTTGALLRAELLPDKSMNIFLSKTRLGMRETSAVELTGKNGGPIQTANLNLSALSPDETRTFHALLKKAVQGLSPAKSEG